jgi:hypothetical protein
MIFERLDFTTNNKIFQSRPKTPSSSSILNLKKNKRFEDLRQKSSRLPKNKEYLVEEVRNFPPAYFHFKNRIAHLFELVDSVIESKEHKDEKVGKINKERYRRLYTPNEKSGSKLRGRSSQEFRSRNGVGLRRIAKKKIEKNDSLNEKIAGWTEDN